MKKAFLLPILMLYAGTAFSQEIVGNITLSRPDIKADIDFYYSAIDMAEAAGIIKVHLVSKCVMFRTRI